MGEPAFFNKSSMWRFGENEKCDKGVIPELPNRRHPSRNSVKTYLDNRAIMLYVTVVTEKRKPILANKAAHDCIVVSWKATNDWMVGRYVIMPDHIHFFCALGQYPPTDFHKWVRKWKALVSRTFPLELREVGTHLPRTNDPAATSAALPRLQPLFQSDCWDRQLRTGDSYAQKWEYVRNNPVRKGLVGHAEDWPSQGEMNVLEWHEKV